MFDGSGFFCACEMAGFEGEAMAENVAADGLSAVASSVLQFNTAPVGSETVHGRDYLVALRFVEVDGGVFCCPECRVNTDE
ncbi:hypothetical protein [Haloarchaeobius amylolyticus]|uniref:hypothetical protein n=1 Tax=Haloarchaeobius amylolyticus TaxID=1198296 RepID=UPI00226E47CD|nr:hypothetical protein [Haloarchaeobius amylolyticus]